MAEAWDGKVERRVQTLQGQQEILGKLDALYVAMDKVVRFIEGNGKPERGAIIRMDRLEQKMLMVWGLVAAVSGLTLKAMWEAIVR